MAERSSISQVVQIGVESTPGTLVAANKLLQSIGIQPNMQADVQTFRPMGTKYQTLAVLGKEWVEASISGRPTYDEIVYLLSSVLTETTPSSAGTNGKLWEFEPNSVDEDSPITLTVEQGSSVRAHRFGYGLVRELSLAFTRDGIELSGSMIGKALEDDITLTATPSIADLVPVFANQVSVYLDPLYANIGDTKMTRVLQVQWQISNRYGPLWVIDADENSWVAHVEIEPQLTAQVTMEADAEGMAVLDQLQAGSVAFMRIEALGDTIAGLTPSQYRLAIDMPVKVAQNSGFSDQDGVFAVQWQFVGVHDETFNTTGGALKFDVTNTLAAL